MSEVKKRTLRNAKFKLKAGLKISRLSESTVKHPYMAALEWLYCLTVMRPVATLTYISLIAAPSFCHRQLGAKSGSI